MKNLHWGFWALSVGWVAAACGNGDDSSNGSSGPSIITTASELEPGDECEAGGTVVRTGTDEDDDGEISASEASSSFNICTAVDGQDGADGTDGTDGTDGADGDDAPPLLATTGDANAATCPNGGSVVSFGQDQDGDGSLDSEEVSASTTICEAAPGADACPPVIRVTPVNPGELCENGGTEIAYGPDDGVATGAGGAGGGGGTAAQCDGVLSVGEETGSRLICNGVDGLDGADGVNGLDGVDGADGADGVDGVDGADGVDGVDGVDGASMLTVITPGDTWPSCGGEGIRVQVGKDDSADSILQEAEIDNTFYVCGTLTDVNLTPATGTLTETDEPLWANKGYRFTATEEFTIYGAEWRFSLQAGGITHVNIYDAGGNVLASGTDAVGDGSEQWYMSAVNFTFKAGETYTVSFYTDRSSSSLFDRQDNPSYNYAVDGLISGVQHVSTTVAGDGGPEAFPTANNTWAPYQRLLIP